MLALLPLDAQNPLAQQWLDTRQWLKDRQGETQLTAFEVRGSSAVGQLHGKDVLEGLGIEGRQEKANTQIRAGVTHLTNRTPPLSFYSAYGLSWGVNSDQGKPRGRTWQWGLTHKFQGLCFCKEAFNMGAPVRLATSFNTPRFMANAWPLNLAHANKACSQKKCHEKKRFELVGRGFMGHGLGRSCR